MIIRFFAKDYGGKLAVSGLLVLSASPVSDVFGGASYAARCRRAGRAAMARGSGSEAGEGVDRGGDGGG